VRINIEFLADDVTLRGWLFTPDEGKGPFPVVIGTHGFAAVKEQSLNEVGEVFSRAGLAALIYDHRCHGESDGLPRGHIDPWAQIHDYRHAISFAETLEVVDRDRIGVWGTSYSGAHTIVVAAVDKRVKAGCSQVPMTAGLDMLQRGMAASSWYPLIDSLEEERRSWAKGNAPKRLAIVAKEPGANAAFISRRSYDFYHHHDAPTWKNDLTLRSIDLALEYDVAPYLERLNTTPFQFVIAEDDLGTPTDLQLQAFARIRGPKELVVIPGDHYTSYLELLPDAAGAAADFFSRQLNRNMWGNARRRALDVKTEVVASSPSVIKAELDSVFDRAAMVLNNGGSAKDVADVFWDDDLYIVGERESHLYRDVQSWVGPFQEYLGHRNTRLKIVGEPRISGDLAAVFVHEHADTYKEYPAEDYRMLCVLRKGPKGWRVTMEMFMPGAL
jgi:fermentation-respiration switch protein FrsA (DUF1100 family)